MIKVRILSNDDWYKRRVYRYVDFFGGAEVALKPRFSRARRMRPGHMILVVLWLQPTVVQRSASHPRISRSSEWVRWTLYEWQHRKLLSLRMDWSSWKARFLETWLAGNRGLRLVPISSEKCTFCFLRSWFYCWKSRSCTIGRLNNLLKARGLCGMFMPGLQCAICEEIGTAFHDIYNISKSVHGPLACWPGWFCS
jgi:hypothetical protein